MMKEAGRVAVVLFNLGGPDRPEAVRPFLRNLFADPAIIGAPTPVRQVLAEVISRARERSAKANYALMGGASPIVPETRAQAAALEAALRAWRPEIDFRVVLAMRHWSPFTEDAVREIETFAPDEVVLLPLYPQFSTTTTASSLARWRTLYRGSAPVRAVCCYYDHPGFIAAHAGKIRAAVGQRPAAGLRLLLSAHGLPERVVRAGDPYQAQIEDTAERIVLALGSGWDWRVCYQSRVGPLKWIGPSTEEAIAEAAGAGLGVVVAPIAFVSEHIETLVELDVEYAELAHRLGAPAYVRVPALGTDEAFIAALRDTVLAALDRPLGCGPFAGGRRCAADRKGCPCAQPAEEAA